MNIVIIGATSGIGKALFEKYANENKRIGIIGRRAHLLDKLYQKYPSKTIPTKADITNMNEIEQAINALHKEMEYIDLAIVCSGTGDINATLDYSIERHAIDTNIGLRFKYTPKNTLNRLSFLLKALLCSWNH